MQNNRFLQIHYLTPYASALLNRDDSGLAKRLPFGGKMRTRISSQCQKRHWRMSDDIHALNAIDDSAASFRSRDVIEKKVFQGWTEGLDQDALAEIKKVMLIAVYGDKGVDKKSRPTLLIGQPEVAYLQREAQRLYVEWINMEVTETEAESGDQDESDKKIEYAKALAEGWLKTHKKNLKALSEGSKMPAGLTGALFGRMVTSDPKANIDGAIYVAHAFTVHEEETESDYFVSVDDLAGSEDTGADAIQETELTSGIFYGYVSVDIPALINNLGGDADLAGDVLHNLIYLIAEVSPGAKKGSTAPFSRASFMLLEAGDRQPRTLADAFRGRVNSEISEAANALCDHLGKMDRLYETGETRKFMSLSNCDVPLGSFGSLKDLAHFAKSLPEAVMADT